MKNRIWQLIFGLTIIAIISLGVWWIVFQKLFPFLSELDPSVLAALVTAIVLAIVAISVKYIEHKHSVEAQFRNDKVELYNDFMEVFDKIKANSISQSELLPFYEEWRRKLLFHCGPEVVKETFNLKAVGPVSSVRDTGRLVEMMGRMILAMRKDVGLSNQNIVKKNYKGVSAATIFGAHYMLRQSNLFLKCLSENPDMPSDEFTALENEIEATDNSRTG